MTERYTATDVELEPRAGFIGFANSVTKRYFWMQPAEETPAKNGIWLERDDQRWGGTGDKWAITLTPSLFVIDTSQLPWMACDSIEISFTADQAKFDLLKQLLLRAMVDCRADLRISEQQSLNGADA